MEAVKHAHQQIQVAIDNYRKTLRQALDAGVKQADIVRELGLTRETIRQDAMSDEERKAIRDAHAARLAERRKKQAD